MPIRTLLCGVAATCLCGVSFAHGEDRPGFRVRADLAAPLNSNAGWAGALNEDVAIIADQPFRLRLEVKAARKGSPESFRLQFRRNQGSWTDIDAHDFPYPTREEEIEFADFEPGQALERWTVLNGDSTDLALVGDDAQTVLRAQAKAAPLTALYAPLWDLDAFAFGATFRLPQADSQGISLIFGYVDADNHGRLVVDGSARTLRLTRRVNGVEAVLAERAITVSAGQWVDVEIKREDGKLEINFQDDALEFSVPAPSDMSSLQIGFQVPAGHSADFKAFVVEGEPRTPPVSIVATPGYANGAATTDVLTGAASAFQPGVGLSLAPRTPPWTGAGSHGEFEWPLVVRRYADGALTNENGDTFEFRMVDAAGAVRNAGRNPVLTLSVPAGHVGGTFVETPGRIGPWQASNGDLYFIMEPTETDNLFMMMKSSDGGRTWHEVDGGNRPRTGDLESVDSRQVGETIHIIHQVTRSTRYHAFRTSDHPTLPDTWAVRDETAAAANSISQGATLAVRSDGSMATFYVGDTIHYATRSTEGVWSPEAIMDEGATPRSAGPQAVLGSNDVIHLAYYGMDGSLWHRRLMPDNTLTERQQLAAGLETAKADFGSVLPLTFIPETDTVVVIYRLADGRLWERRITGEAPPRAPVMVTDRDVVADAVDSQQPGADVVVDGNTTHVLFIDASTRALFSTQDNNGWRPSALRIGDITGSWVRGNIYTRSDGVRVYGYIYDAGSEGGSGMNRFAEIELGARVRP